MQNVEIEIVADSVQEAIEATINQTAEKFGVDLIATQRYSCNEIENHFMVPGRAWRVSLDFETDPDLFDFVICEEGYISQFECE